MEPILTHLSGTEASQTFDQIFQIPAIVFANTQYNQTHDDSASFAPRALRPFDPHMPGFPFRQRGALDRHQPAPQAWNQNPTKKGQAMGGLVKMAGDCEGGTCPAVFRKTSGGWVFRGPTVTDPATLAEFALPAHESAVLLPDSIVEQLLERLHRERIA